MYTIARNVFHTHIPHLAPPPPASQWWWLALLPPSPSRYMNLCNARAFLDCEGNIRTRICVFRNFAYIWRLWPRGNVNPTRPQSILTGNFAFHSRGSARFVVDRLRKESLSLLPRISRVTGRVEFGVRVRAMYNRVLVIPLIKLRNKKARWAWRTINALRSSNFIKI